MADGAATAHRGIRIGVRMKFGCRMFGVSSMVHVAYGAHFGKSGRGYASARINSAECRGGGELDRGSWIETTLSALLKIDELFEEF